jgi:flagellar biosynthesis protein FlhB
MRKIKLNQKAFSFIVPMTLAIVVGFAIMAVGGYVVGEVSSTLEDSFGTATSRSANENDTVNLLGNITGGFSDVVDIEIVVIIITALSMAIFAVMAVGSRRGMI